MDLKTNGIQHIGLPTGDFDGTCAFYEALGFSCKYAAGDAGGRVAFYVLDRSLTMEIYESATPVGAAGAIDHIAIDCTDIESAYRSAVDAGLKIVSDGIDARPFWCNGIRFFIVEGPNAERIELCQIL